MTASVNGGTGAQLGVLISSAGRRVGLLQTFHRALQALGLTGRVLAADVSAVSAAFHVADRSYLVPPCTSEEFIPTVLEICEREGVRLVVPTIDTELPAYATHRDRFAERGITVAVSAPGVIAIGADKSVTHAWLEAHGFPTVRQSTIDDVMARPTQWPFPLLVKPRVGSSSKGVAVVRSARELRVTCGDDFLVQTIAPGIEHTVDLLVDRDGRCRCAVPRRRLEVRGGEVSKAVTVRHGPLEDLSSRIGEALPGAFGALNVQIFLGPDDQLSVVELNPRFGGGFPLAWQAGADYPRWMIEELLGAPSTVSRNAWRAGLVMLRYDEAVFVEAEEIGL